MKNTTFYSFTMLLALVCTSFSVKAQDLPRPSPAQEVTQRVGLTDITVTYSRPSAKGRVIFGELVPFGEMWRLGANERTTFTTTDDIIIGGESLDAGTYGLIAIPGEKEWTLIFSSESEGWGTGGYDKKDDVIRVKAAVKKGTENVESLTIGFDKLETKSAHFIIAWTDARVAIPVNVEVEKKAMENIKASIAAKPDDFKVYRGAASYCAESETNLKQGMEWINKSLEMEKNWYSYWVKADLQAASRDYEGAIESAKMAIQEGEAASKKSGNEFKYKAQLEKSIAEWNTIK